ncbi:hypothetical protein [Cupriavidus lacunae]|uniref:hypothetical protein n=1 Tax=Cupriavidus lacunae TaxID=2666307 RepID=UPI0010583C76|nr:hypothetical protein [Cupriavidus lacunae]
MPILDKLSSGMDNPTQARRGMRRLWLAALALDLISPTIGFCPVVVSAKTSLNAGCPPRGIDSAAKQLIPPQAISPILDSVRSGFLR